MKYGNFISKLLSLLLVLGVLVYYQHVAQARAALVAENEAAVAEVEAYNAEILGVKSGTVSYLDGTYEGTGFGFGGDITVSVVISDGRIDSIAVLSHEGEDAAYYDLAKSVVDAVLEAQSTAVDTVSGATFTSLGLLEAIDQAMEQAVK